MNFVVERQSTAREGATKPNLYDYRNSSGQLTLEGHFDKVIATGEHLIFRAENIKIELFKNDKKIYSFGAEGSYPCVSRTPGNQWDVFISPRIEPGDRLRVVLTTCYRDNPANPFAIFINNIYKGDTGLLFIDMLKKHGLNLLIGGFVLLSGIFLLISSALLKMIKTPISNVPIHFALFSIVIGLWPCIQYDLTSLLYPCYLPVSILDISCMILACPLYLMYVLNFMKSGAWKILKLCQWVWLTVLALVLGAQALGLRDVFEWLRVLVSLFAVTVVVCFLCLLYELLGRHGQTHRAVRLTLITVGIFSFFTVLGIVNYVYPIWPSHISSALSLLVFVLPHLFYLLSYLRESLTARQRVAELENELTQSRISIMMSQIKPHFLFNALTCIAHLCNTNPKMAENATIAFSTYLRGNLDSLAQTNLVAFEKELLHVKTYLFLEQLRFGDALQIEYDIETSDFLLPALTIQPLVENAVKNGVGKKDSGGTVTIKSCETTTEYRIIISDNGVGYDPSRTRQDGERTHIGIANVRSRLAAQCQGKLSVESTEGTGTVVTVSIPK